LKLEKLKLAVGAGPLILEVMAVMDAPVCVAVSEIEVEFEVTVALADVVFPPLLPPLLPPVDEGDGEASVLVIVGCPSR
jgi:hypothetical protein